jgi:flagellar L-ring protein precursor FlgH
MKRLTFVVTALYVICCMMAFGQVVPASLEIPAAKEPSDGRGETRAADESPRPKKKKSPIVGSLVDSSAGYVASSLMAQPKRQPKLLKQHDLVTIIIREESQSSSKGLTDLKKSTDLDAKIDTYVKLNFQKLSLDAKTPSIVPEIKGEASRNTKGEATVDRSDTFTTRLGGEVLDVKPNGTLVLQAHAHVKIDSEEQDILISGVCRAEDVGPDNSILSSILSDLDVKKTSSGPTKDTTTPGFIPRMLNKINPF